MVPSRWNLSGSAALHVTFSSRTEAGRKNRLYSLDPSAMLIPERQGFEWPGRLYTLTPQVRETVLTPSSGSNLSTLQ